jgi:hypothetical protein
MRLMALILAATVAAAAPAAADPPTGHASSGDAVASPAQDAGSLPVSIDKIRDALARTPATPLRGLDEQPRFKSGVSEKQRIDDLIATLDFTSGPPVPGGVYGYAVSQQAFPSVDNPRLQPYAAFSQPELLTIAIENLEVRYLGGRALNAVSSAERARAEQAARDEVQRALAAHLAGATDRAVTTLNGLSSR